MLVSSIMNFQTARFAPGNDLPYQLFLPTYAASAWYHGKLKGDLAKDLSKTLARAEQFVLKDYALALMQGDTLPTAERSRIAKELVALTGLPEEYVLKQNLRLNIFGFVTELMKNENRNIGRFDRRIVGSSDNGGGGAGGIFDPCMVALRVGATRSIKHYGCRDP